MLPVRAGNMNYLCVVYGAVFPGVAEWWFLEGNKSFKEREDGC